MENPYEPVAATATPEQQDAVFDQSVLQVDFRTNITNDRWDAIREEPRYPSKIASLIMLAGAISVCILFAAGIQVLPEAYERALVPVAGPIATIAVFVFILRLESNKTAQQIAPADALVWMRGHVSGSMSRDVLVIQSESVCLGIRTKSIRHMEWFAGALQVFFGPFSIPKNPQRRLSLPAEAFADETRTVFPLLGRFSTKPLKTAEYAMLIERVTAASEIDVQTLDWHIQLDEHVRRADLQNHSSRRYIRRFWLAAIALATLVYTVFLARVYLLPVTWQPRQEYLLTVLSYAILPIIGWGIYFINYFACSKIRVGSVCGWIGGKNDESYLCLANEFGAVLYRDAALENLYWKQDGLEVCPSKNLMVFLFPARIFTDQEQSLLKIKFPPDRLSSPQERNWIWEGPFLKDVHGRGSKTR